MNFKISRYNPSLDEKVKIIEYTLNVNKQLSVLEALDYVKENEDQTLSYRCGCQSGVCGSCAILVNGVEKLACKTPINENDTIEPLKYISTIKDLVVDLKHESKVLKQSKAYLQNFNNQQITIEDEKAIDRQSNCILCQSCYSSCPVYEVNKDFLGPYALTRALRYVNDKKEKEAINIIDSVQKSGIWDCTLCGNCTMVCPQFIDPKTDIMNLRMKSIQNGYEDPTMQNFSGINNEFNAGFDPSGGFDTGFNPNGF